MTDGPEGRSTTARATRRRCCAETRFLRRNSARSQMAEAMLNAWGGDRFQAFSAGTEATGIKPETIQVMFEIGLDLSSHRSKTIESSAGKPLSGSSRPVTRPRRTARCCPASRTQRTGASRTPRPRRDRPRSGSESSAVSGITLRAGCACSFSRAGPRVACTRADRSGLTQSAQTAAGRECTPPVSTLGLATRRCRRRPGCVRRIRPVRRSQGRECS